MKTDSKLSRRDFLKISAIGAAGVVGTMLVPGTISSASAKSKKTSANDDVVLGFIGMGQQGNFLLDGFLQIPGVKVVAGADVYDVKRARFEKKVKDFYAKKGVKCDVKTYENYEEVLARPDIDAVVIAVPDHSHAYIAIAACRAGKDVYLEKPMTFTIFEGQQLRKAVRENNRILQVGSQQRSSWEFIHAANLCREGKLGKISYIKAQVGEGPKPYDLPEQPVPAGLNWDRWLGPLNNPKIHYNEQLNPPISIDPPKNEEYWGAWRWYKEMGGGYTTDWGAHMFDIGQWCIGKDLNGPVEIIPPGYAQYDSLTYIYDNGIVMAREQLPNNDNGVQVFGENGWIMVNRGKFAASDPEFMPSEDQKDDSNLPFETKIPHQAAFISAVRTRIDPNVPVEVGHSSCTVCTLGNIAMELKRPLHWNPIVEKFVDDPEATKYLHYTYRDGYTL